MTEKKIVPTEFYCFKTMHNAHLMERAFEKKNGEWHSFQNSTYFLTKQMIKETKMIPSHFLNMPFPIFLFLSKVQLKSNVDF